MTLDNRSMKPLHDIPLPMLDLVSVRAGGSVAEALAGSQTVRPGPSALLWTTDADELMLVCDRFDPALRLRSLDIVAAACAG